MSESSDARLARIDERTAHVAEALGLLRNEIAAQSARNDAALREHEGRMVARIENVQAHVTGEMFALRQDKDREHAELTAGQDRLAKRVATVEEKVDGFESLIDRAKGATAAARVLYGAGGLTIGGILVALGQAVFGG